MTYFRLSQTENITNQLYANMYCKLQWGYQALPLVLPLGQTFWP